MKNTTHQFITSSAIYFIGNILSKLAVFFMIPLYTHYIQPADYGYYDVSMAYLNIFSSALFFDIWSTIMRFMFDESQVQEKYKVIYNGFVIMLGSFVIYGIAAGGFYIAFEIPYFFLIVLCGVGSCWQNFYSYIARGFGQNFLFASSGIMNTMVMVTANIIFIVWLQWDYSALYISFLLGVLVQVALLESKVRVFCHFEWSWFNTQLMLAMIRYSLPLCLNSVCYWFLTDYNRTVIFTRLTAYENGLFAMAGKFALALMLVATCFNLAWQEMAFAKGSIDDSGVFYSKAGSLFLRFLLCGGLVLISTVAVVFPFMVDPAYAPARRIIPLYLVATMASIYSLFLGNIFGAIKKTNIIFISTVGACLVNVFILHSLIDFIGVQAAALSLLGGYLANIGIRLLLLKKEINYQIKSNHLFAVIPILLIASAVYFQMDYIANCLMLFSGIVFSFIFLHKDILGMLESMRGVKF
jgi:O-antigen/teichoic acid export membrane protein